MELQQGRDQTTTKPRPAGPGERRAAGPPPVELISLASKLAGRRVTFRGASPAQRAFASSVRVVMLREAVARRDRDRELILRAVADPNWFASQATTMYEQINWPRPDQLATPEGPDAPSPTR